MHSIIVWPFELNVQLQTHTNFMLFFVDLSNLLLYCTQFSFAPISPWFGSFTSLRVLIANLYKKVSLPSFWFRAVFKPVSFPASLWPESSGKQPESLPTPVALPGPSTVATLPQSG